MVPVIWLALIDAIYSRITSFFALNHIFFPANEVATLKTKQPIRFQGLFKVTDQIAGKWKTCGKFCNFSLQNSYFFSPKKWMNLISNWLSITLIKYLNWPSPVFGWFQNGCNKVVIEPRVVQFWSEIILVISNRTRTARSFNFEITRMISAQIALYSVQLPLFITPILKSLLVPVMWLALIVAIYSWIAPFFALNHIFFPASEAASLKTKQQIRFQGLLKTTNQIAEKWETTSIMRQILQLSFPKLFSFPPKNGWI